MSLSEPATAVAEAPKVRSELPKNNKPLVKVKVLLTVIGEEALRVTSDVLFTLRL